MHESFCNMSHYMWLVPCNPPNRLYEWGAMGKSSLNSNKIEAHNVCESTSKNNDVYETMRYKRSILMWRKKNRIKSWKDQCRLHHHQYPVTLMFQIWWLPSNVDRGWSRAKVWSDLRRYRWNDGWRTSTVLGTTINTSGMTFNLIWAFKSCLGASIMTNFDNF